MNNAFGNPQHVLLVGGTSEIGLAIVQDLLRLHGCTIKAESRLGEGSVFTFSLPLAAGGSGNFPGSPKKAGAPPGEADGGAQNAAAALELPETSEPFAYDRNSSQPDEGF